MGDVDPIWEDPLAVQVIPVPGSSNGSTATAAEVLYATARVAETQPGTPVL